jgi:hypothetical protein
MGLSDIKELNKSLRITWLSFLTIIAMVAVGSYFVTAYLTTIDYDKVERERIEKELKSNIKELNLRLDNLSNDLENSKEYLNGRMNRKIEGVEKLMEVQIKNLEKRVDEKSN